MNNSKQKREIREMEIKINERSRVIQEVLSFIKHWKNNKSTCLEEIERLYHALGEELTNK